MRKEGPMLQWHDNPMSQRTALCLQIKKSRGCKDLQSLVSGHSNGSANVENNAETKETQSSTCQDVSNQLISVIALNPSILGAQLTLSWAKKQNI